MSDIDLDNSLAYSFALVNASTGNMKEKTSQEQRTCSSYVVELILIVPDIVQS